MKHGMALAVVAAVLLLASAHQVAARRSLLAGCGAQLCPSGYTAVGDRTSACGYECWTAAKLNCPAGPLQQPRICGGTSKKLCPSIACAYSSTYAVSGPTGCAAAQATISAIGNSATNITLNTGGLMGPIMNSYCTADPSATSLSVAASNAATAYASTVASVFTQYNTYVCSCCTGNSKALAVVGANAQAVAIAQANSTQFILGQLTTCFQGDEELLAAAASYATAFARDVQLAITSVYQKAVSKGGNSCSASGMVTDMKSAIASATVCTFVNIFAAAIDAQTPGVTYACASSLSISGLPYVSTCPININCPCTPTGYQYNNLGFEQGTFDAGDGTTNPVWAVMDASNGANGGAFTPYVSSREIVKTRTGNRIRIDPYEGDFFAVVPAPPHTKPSLTTPSTPGPSPPSGISTTITVPPCANQLSFAFIFKCGNSKFGNSADDQATVTLTWTDVFNTTNTGSAVIQPTCANVNNGAATNDGDWTVTPIAIAYGEYSVSITADATSSQTFGATELPPTLYVDDFSFSNGAQPILR